MEQVARVSVSGIMLPDDMEYKINEYFTLSKYKGNTVIFAKIVETPPVEATPSLLISVLNLAFPTTLISTHCSYSPEAFYKQLWQTNVLFSYYGESEYTNVPKEICSDDIDRLTRWYTSILEHNNAIKEDSNVRCSPWNVAWNEYIDACSCGIVEKAFAHLITALEAIVVDSTTELNYRVSLHASVLAGSNEDERNKIFDYVKTSYDYRSKSVHGDGKNMKKKFKKEDVYTTFFELKWIVATIMEKTYKKDKAELVKAITKALHSCPEVKI